MKLLDTTTSEVYEIKIIDTELVWEISSGVTDTVIIVDSYTHAKWQVVINDGSLEIISSSGSQYNPIILSDDDTAWQLGISDGQLTWSSSSPYFRIIGLSIREFCTLKTNIRDFSRARISMIGAYNESN